MGRAQIDAKSSRVSCFGRKRAERKYRRRATSSFELGDLKLRCLSSSFLSVLLLFLNLLVVIQAYQSEPALLKLDALKPDCGRHNFRGFKIQENCFGTCKEGHERRHRRSAGELESANVTEEEEVERVLGQILNSNSDERAQPEDGSSRASAGYTTPLDEFPNYVKLYPWDDYTRYRTCGGTLIHKNVVFTAGHCLAYYNMTRDYFQAVANEAPKSRPWLVKHAKNLYGKIAGGSEGHEQWANVVAACLHEKSFGPNKDEAMKSGSYDRFFAYDFAVLKLDKEFSYNKYVQPACFDFQRQRKQSINYVFAGAGMMTDESKGKPVFPDSKITLALNERPCQHQPNQACFETFDEKNYKGHICRGDSGSGLFCFDTCGTSPKAYVVGTASSGYDYSYTRKCVPGWSSVSKFMDLYELRHVVEQCARTLDTLRSGNGIMWVQYN